MNAHVCVKRMWMFIPWTSGWEHLHLHTFSQLWSICRCHHQWNFRFMQRRSLCFSTKVYSSFLFHFLIPVQCLSSGHRVWTFEQIISQAGSWFRGFLFAGLYSALCYFLFTSIRKLCDQEEKLTKILWQRNKEFFHTSFSAVCWCVRWCVYWSQPQKKDALSSH